MAKRPPDRARTMMETLRSVLEGIAELSGLTLCLHDLADFTRGARLPKGMRMHSHPFCANVKLDRQDLCYRDDFRRANARAGKLRRPFVKRCHAGVSELVVPILLAGEHVGTIFAGPVRLKGEKSPKPAADLSLRSRAELMRLGKVVSVIAGFAAQAAEALAIQELEGRARSEPVRRALRFAAENYPRAITVENAAREVFLSASRFAHVFSKEMGIPFHRYLAALRISRAKSLLSSSSMRIIDVAARCGFCNQNYFAGVFKKETGKTPREYRRAQQESIDI
jgi:AraC-like DNA-binding protein